MKTITIPDGYNLVYIPGWSLAVQEEDKGDRPSGTHYVAVSVESGVLKQEYVDAAVERVKQIVELNKKEAVKWKEESLTCGCQVTN